MLAIRSGVDPSTAERIQGNWQIVLQALIGLGVHEEEIEPDLHPLDVGLHSIALMQLLEEFRKVNGATLEFSEVLECSSLEEICERAAEVATEGPADSTASTAEHVAALPSVENEPDHPDDEIPMTPMAHAYWAGSQDASDGGVTAHFYHEFSGHGVEPDRLAAALTELTHRHEMLRARITGYGTWQISDTAHPDAFAVFDLRSVSQVERQRTLEEVRRTMLSYPMDSEAGQTHVVRLTLLPDGRTRLHVLLDMGVADAPSFRSFLRELAHLYNHPDSPAPALPGVRDVIRRRHSHAQETRERDQRWWTARLGELPGAPDLPTAGAEDTPEVPHRRIGHHLDADVSRGFTDAARSLGITPTALLLELFSVTLGAWAGEPRFLLNVPVFSRPRDDTRVDDVIGDFTGSVVIDADGRPGTLAERGRQTALVLADALGHRSYDGVDVLRDLGALRNTRHLAPVVFTSAVELGELYGEEFLNTFGDPTHTVSHSPRVWLDCQVTGLRGGMAVNWDLRCGVFDDAVVDAMFEAFVGLMHQVATGEIAAGDQIAVAVPGEQVEARRLAVEREDRAAAEAPATPVAAGDLLHGGVWQRARQHPDTVAVFDGAREVTTGRLVAAAAGLSARLLELGSRPGDERVVVCAAPSAEQTAAVLGVVGAGAAYVPLDPEDPVARREQITRVCDATVVITDIPDDPAWAGTTVIDANTLLEAPGADPDQVWAQSPPSPEDTAYVIFTSGTTGVPKGVVISHRAATTTLSDVCRRYGVGPHDRVAAVSALSFDLSVFDVFGVLGCGGAMVVCPRGRFADPSAWADLVLRHRVTVWNTTPAQLTMLLDTVDAGAPAPTSLRLAMVSGDWVDPHTWERTTRYAPDCRVESLGGATEAGIWSIRHRMGSASAERSWVPYGVALSGQRVVVADSALRPRPDGVVGQILIGGAALADGYLADQERTAAAFVTDMAGQRWYRTGDQGMYLADGSIRFLGRADTQVKVNGYRIELTGIEHAIKAHSDVHQVACAATGDEIVAGVVLRTGEGGGSPLVEELVAVQREALPASHVCTRIRFFDSLPLTDNGKVDRKALVELVAATNDALPPREPITDGHERAVADVWEHVLGKKVRDRTAEFLAIGGNSLSGTRVIARLRKEGLHASLMDLFDNSALAEFAARVTPLESAPAEERGADVASVGRVQPLTDVQRAYLAGRHPSFELGGVDCSFYREFRYAGLDLAKLEAALETVTSRHPILRSRITEAGIVHDPGLLAPPVRLFESPEAMNAALAGADFDPEEGLHIRVGAAPDGEATRIGIATATIAMDAAGTLRFYHELDTAYLRPEELGAAPEPASPAQAWSGRERGQAADYWTRVSGSLPPAPPLPQLREPDTVTRPAFERLSRSLEAATDQALREAALRNRTTPAMIAYTAYAETLRRFTGVDQLALTVTAFDRPDPDFDGIGDFTSLVLASYERAGDRPFAKDVARASSSLLEAMDHRAVSAIDIVRQALALNPGSAAYPVVFTAALGLEQELPQLTGVLAEQVGGVATTPQTVLDCQVSEVEGRITLNWDYVRELLPGPFVEEAFGHFLELITHAAHADWAAPAPAYGGAGPVFGAPQPADRRTSLHAPVLQSVQRYPERTAIITPEGDGSRALTYRELGARAEGLARRLQEEGVTVGTHVTVRSSSVAVHAVAWLATLRLGAVVVPIGADQPESRVEAIRRLCQSALDLDDAILDDGLEESRTAGAPEVFEPDAAHTAYVIFTSGTTGNPKGVVIGHGAATSTIAAVNEHHFGAEPDVALATSAPDFDLAVFDLFGGLARGATVVDGRGHDPRDAATTAALIRRFEVNSWNTVPALGEMLAMAAGPDTLPSLRTILVSGDKVDLGLRDRLEVCVPGITLIAMGGATEAGIWSNHVDAAALPDDGGTAFGTVPYGRPLDGQGYDVVGRDGHSLPRWAAGELVILGNAVGSGYLGSDGKVGLTGGFHRAPEGDIRYRTGDAGRIRPDGTIEILGRLSGMIKVRGQRIEPGAVDLVARSLPWVTDAVTGVDGDRLVLAVARGLPQAATLPEPLPPLAGELLPSSGFPPAREEAQGRLENVLDLLEEELREGRVATPFLPVLEFWRTRARAARRPVETRRSQVGPTEADRSTAQRLAEILRGDAPPSSIVSVPELDPARQLSTEPVSAAVLHVLETVLREATNGVVVGDLGVLSSVTEKVRLAPAAAMASVLASHEHDVVVAPFSLHPFAERRSALRRLWALAAPGARVVAADISRLSELGALTAPLLDPSVVDSLLEESQEPGPWHTICAGEIWAREAAECGFTVRGFRSVGGVWLLDLEAPDPGVEGSVETLRSAVLEQLPASHLPSRIAEVDAVTLTRNGKVDVAATLRVCAAPAREDTTVQTPLDELERVVLDLWTSEVTAEPVGLTTGIFEAGGTSLSAARLTRVLQERLCPQVGLRHVLDDSSVRGIARTLREHYGVDLSNAEEGEL